MFEDGCLSRSCDRSFWSHRKLTTRCNPMQQTCRKGYQVYCDWKMHWYWTENCIYGKPLQTLINSAFVFHPNWTGSIEVCRTISPFNKPFDSFTAQRTQQILRENWKCNKVMVILLLSPPAQSLSWDCTQSNKLCYCSFTQSFELINRVLNVRHQIGTLAKQRGLFIYARKVPYTHTNKKEILVVFFSLLLCYGPKQYLSSIKILIVYLMKRIFRIPAQLILSAKWNEIF